MKGVLLGLFILFLSGCGMKKFAVEHADFFIYHETSKRLPVSSSQKKEFYRHIKTFLNESKTMGLELHSILDTIQLKEEMNLEKNYERLESLYLRIIKDFTKIILKQILQLDSKQQVFFLEKIKTENLKILSKTKQEKIKNVESKLKKMIGNLGEDQKKLISDFSDYFHERDEKRAQRRMILYQSLKDIFEENSPQDQKQEKIQKCFDEFQAQMHTGNRNLEFIKKLSKTMTEKQMNHFTHSLEDMKEILRLYHKTQYSD
jgi:hypothetical protein